MRRDHGAANGKFVPVTPSSPDPETDELEQALREVRQRFSATFASQCDALQSALMALGAPGTNPVEVRGVVHKLVGLAGTVGFPSVSQKAAELEDLLFNDLVHPADALASLSAMREAFVEDSKQNSDSLPSPAAHGPAASPVNATILLVDDDNDQRMITRLTLERGGYRVVTLPSAETLIETAREVRPDLIILDVMMPGIDGHLACRLLKSDPDVSHVPVMFCSSRSTIDERMAGLALGAIDYISKPLDPSELLFRLKRILATPAVASAPKPPSGVVAPAIVDLETNLPAYSEFLRTAGAVVAAAPCAVALIRVDAAHRSALTRALGDELRRRDVAGEFDRLHVVVVFADLAGRVAVDRLKPMVDALLREDVEVRIGVASSPVAGGFTLDALISAAEEALAQARFHGLAIAQHGDRTATADHDTPARHLIRLADDDPEVMRIVDAQMRSLRFETVLTFDGEAALVALAGRPIDLLVLDLMLPKVTGFEILHRLRDLPPPRAKVIVLSARGREEDITRAFDLGADDYLTKPFRPQELAARVVRLLR
jgi:DNA-binding response OmpR family regulator/HPt (histidine-containing phosphotransfer) domain-containing protein